MAIQSAAGASIGISAAAPATYDATGYAALTYTNIAEVTNLGGFGREYTVITHNPIDTRATKKLKGSYNEGQITLTVGLDTADAGQALCATASVSDADYSFRVEMQNGAIYYFPAKVASFKRQVGSVDDIVSAEINLEITSSTGGVGVVEDI